MASTKKTAAFNFTDGFKELEKLVADFESREIDLEKDLPHFERGLKLAQQLQRRLKEIENKVVEIDRRFSEPTEEK
ncbi:MAG: exodeoxyribonuclease VII small subunit [Candidatus Andersenbacteria bacterium CG10_big_fil_rev_8_21_14_0_10_54_11]|uniref:Exodeoxyribonuclease 7 small subunit n=1 Tax=Candidatus Andersenbacteria bacterium CG10_big_fil_rev_8_21_14_0_10_54_11 TaxID=1974485 RepID=A0A2M6X0D1_9BACT|nr:MAG: exodeoxyribonuclease VII small subunit [Candidatus Andersenbacteria bacterium CG10_big_fil_rev_8_21_14_0_10_54_11]